MIAGAGGDVDGVADIVTLALADATLDVDGAADALTELDADDSNVGDTDIDIVIEAVTVAELVDVGVRVDVVVYVIDTEPVRVTLSVCDALLDIVIVADSVCDCVTVIVPDKDTVLVIVVDTVLDVVMDGLLVKDSEELTETEALGVVDGVTEIVLDADGE